MKLKRHLSFVALLAFTCISTEAQNIETLELEKYVAHQDSLWDDAFSPDSNIASFTPDDMYDAHINVYRNGNEVLMLNVAFMGCSSGSSYSYYLKDSRIIAIRLSESGMPDAPDEQQPEDYEELIFLTDGQTRIQTKDQDEDHIQELQDQIKNEYLPLYKSSLETIKNSDEW